MAYDDGYYYGMARLVCLGTDTSYNEKKVTVSDGTNEWTGYIANQRVEFLIPGKNRYTITLSTGYSTTVELSYGECLAVYLEKGHDVVHFKDLEAYVQFTDLLSYNEIKTATSLTNKGISAAGVKDLISKVEFDESQIKSNYDSIQTISNTTIPSIRTEIANVGKAVNTNTTNISANKNGIDYLTYRADNVDTTITQMKSDFRDGVSVIKNAIIQKGVTPAGDSPSDMARAILEIASGRSHWWTGKQDISVTGTEYSYATVTKEVGTGYTLWDTLYFGIMGFNSGGTSGGTHEGSTQVDVTEYFSNSITYENGVLTARIGLRTNYSDNSANISFNWFIATIG